MKGLPKDWEEQIRAAYPKRSGGQGWAKVRQLIPRHVKNGCTFEDILAGTKHYAEWCEATGKVRTELVKMAQTFYGPGMWWAEDYEIHVSDGYDDLRRWADG